MTAIKIRTRKHPEEVLKFAHDWADALLFDGEDIGDTVDTHAVAVVSGDAVVDSSALVGTRIEYVVSGGTSGVTTIKLTANTTNGRVFVDQVALEVGT